MDNSSFMHYLHTCHQHSGGLTRTILMQALATCPVKVHLLFDLFISDAPLTLCDSFKILGVIFDNKFICTRFLLQLHRRLVY